MFEPATKNRILQAKEWKLRNLLVREPEVEIEKLNKAAEDVRISQLRKCKTQITMALPETIVLMNRPNVENATSFIERIKLKQKAWEMKTVGEIVEEYRK
jgi:hypothetical protein